MNERTKKTDYSEEAYYKKLEGDLFPLMMMTLKIEELISDYELKKTEDLWDENILGEESFGKFYTGNGFTALNYIIQKKPEALDSIKITR